MAKIRVESKRICMVFVLTTLLAGCSTSDETDTKGGQNGDSRKKITVICTTTMIADLAQNIVGDLADVRGMMKAGEDPHVYKIKAQDADKLSAADVVLANGFHLEATLGTVIKNNAEGEIVQLAELAVKEPLRSAEEAGGGDLPDPHCWMDVRHFIGYVAHARDALAKADPSNADKYRDNADKYISELKQLDAWIKEEFAKIPRNNRVMITSHDAFQYLAAAYEIDVHAMIGISTEQRVLAQYVEKLETLIEERGIRAMFFETSVSETLNNLVRKSAEEKGIEIGGTLYSDSLDEQGRPAGTYIGMMRHNVSIIVAALR